MSKPQRIQMSRQRKWKPEGAKVVICDRRGQWGNPFLTVDAYRRWLQGKTLTAEELGDAFWHVNYAKGTKNLTEGRQWQLEHLLDLKDADYVACWCPPERECHCDVLLELLEG